MKSRYALMLSIVLGILATAGLKKILDRQERKVEEEDKPVAVAVARRNLPAGTILKMEDIAEGQIPRRHFHGLVTPREAEETIVGRRLKEYIPEKGFFRSIDVELPRTEKEVLAIETGRRLITVQVDLYSGVGGRLRPGSRVDVISILRDEGETSEASKKGSRRGERVLTVLEDVRVFTVGPVDITKVGYAREGSLYTAVTLDVTPDEAELMAFAASQGKIQMVERSDLDDRKGDLPPEGITGEGFLRRVRASRPK